MRHKIGLLNSYFENLILSVQIKYLVSIVYQVKVQIVYLEFFELFTMTNFVVKDLQH